ncbi:MAG: hypothetical protein ACOX8B_09150 [Lachnospiraceae bacterium]|jgi:hypothetical protein
MEDRKKQQSEQPEDTGYTLEQLKSKKKEIGFSLLLIVMISLLLVVFRRIGGAALEFYSAAFPYLVVGILILSASLIAPEQNDGNQDGSMSGSPA